MKKGNWFGALMLLVWAAWLNTLLLVAAGRVWPAGGAGLRFLPDATLVLLMALAVRVPRPQVWVVAGLLALVRIAYSADAPLAIFAGYAWVAFALNGLRRGFDVSGPMPRTLLAFAAGLLVAVWNQGVHWLRQQSASAWIDHDFWTLVRHSVPGAIVGALAVGLLGHALAALPGLGTLYRRPKIG
ncbi:MAG: hypothetical protein R3F33_12510 [Planctomycetota bacterium]